MKVRDFAKWISENDEICQGGPTSGEGRIKDVERKTNLVIPIPLRELYRLYDGVEMPHGYIPPLQGESSLPEMLEIIKDADLGWDLATWLPFFDYQTGDYDAIEIKNAKGRVARLARCMLLGEFLVREWAELFRGMEEEDLERMAASFRFESCVEREGLNRVLREHARQAGLA